MERHRAEELYQARRAVLRIQRELEAGNIRAALPDAYTAPGRYPEVFEARLVAAQARFEAHRLRAASQQDEDEDEYEALSGIIWFLKEQLWGDPSLWPCKALLAEIYRHRDDEGDLARAEESQAEATSEAPDTAEAWYIKSFTKLNLSEPLRCVRKAVARDPSHALAWERLTYLADQLGALAVARNGIERLISIDPDNPEWPVLRGYLLAKLAEQNGDREERPSPPLAEAQDVSTRGTEGAAVEDGAGHSPSSP
jgi:tetratricopeptide (TPR) repeat protein